MRYSPDKKLAVTKVGTKTQQQRWAKGLVPRSNATFFSQVGRQSREDDRVGGVLLVGGTSAADVAVQQAQSWLRFDRLPSRWSHVVVVLDWPDRAEPGRIIGAEVALQPQDWSKQVPERNGVTLRDLGAYADRRRFPNLAFAALCLGASERITAALKGKVVKAVLNPTSNRSRYPLWAWLGPWHHHVFEGGENPLRNQIPHPAAAFCEYAFGAAGLDITPGATEPNVCPEMLWSTLLYWHKRLDRESSALRVWSSLDKDRCIGREAESKDLKRDFRAFQGARAAKPRRRRRKTKSKARRRKA